VAASSFEAPAPAVTATIDGARLLEALTAQQRSDVIEFLKTQ
jgi:hypothetical protein